MFCTQCGKKLNAEDKFCSSCGARNAQSEPVEAASVSEPEAPEVEAEEVAVLPEDENTEVKPTLDELVSEEVVEEEVVEEAAEHEVSNFDDLFNGVVEEEKAASVKDDGKLMDTDTKVFVPSESEEPKSADKLTELIENQDFENQAHEMEVARELFFEDEVDSVKYEDDDFYSPLEEETKKEKKQRLRNEKKRRLEEEEEIGKPKSSAGRVILKIILALLIILLVIEIAVIGIKILFPESKAGEFVDEYITKTIDLFKGGDSEDTEAVDESNVDTDQNVRNKPDKDLSGIIAENEDLNSAGTIGAIAYSSNLKFSKDADYEDDAIVKSKPISDNVWYSEGNRYFYYDESTVENMINYEVQKLNLINNQDDSVLKMVKKDSELYEALSNSEGTVKEELLELNIGEIRKEGDTVFVWVEEKVKTTQNGKANERERQRVYSMDFGKDRVIKINGFESL